MAGDARAQVEGDALRGDGMMLALALADVARERHALSTTILDLRGLSHVADYFVICHGRNDRQVKAVADAVVEWREKPLAVEGYESLRWVLVDFVDVVVHIFEAEAREFYAIERLWGDAPTQVFPDDGEAAQAEATAREPEV